MQEPTVLPWLQRTRTTASHAMVRVRTRDSSDLCVLVVAGLRTLIRFALSLSLSLLSLRTFAISSKRCVKFSSFHN